MGVDNSLRLDQFANNFKVVVNRLTDEDMEFDMIGIDPSIANAFRRILIAEVRFYTQITHFLSLSIKYSSIALFREVYCTVLFAFYFMFSDILDEWMIK